MATATEIDIETQTSSDELERLVHCRPCELDGRRLLAVVYCLNCREHLCQLCYNGHLIPSMTKKHVLLDKEHVTEIESRISCPQHSDSDVEFHCSTHSFLGCSKCFFHHQKSCKNSIYIPEAFPSTVNSNAFLKLYDNLTDITRKCTDMLSDIESKRETIKSDHSAALIALKNFKHGLLIEIEILEKELTEKVDKAKETETAKMELLSWKCKTVMENTKKMINSLKMLETKDISCDLYVKFIESKNAIERMEDEAHLIKREQEFKRIFFRANMSLQDILISPLGLGSLQQKGLVMDVYHEQDLVSLSESDASTCCITGLAPLTGQIIVVVDRATGNTIKLFDRNKNTIQRVLKLSSQAYGVCKITDSLISVTLPSERKIAFIRTEPMMNMVNTVRVNGEPRGIGYSDGKLVVSYRDTNKVEILDMQTACSVISVLEKDQNGQPLFNGPFCLAIHPTTNLIYVSNDVSNNVICMTFDGSVLATYEDNALKYPRQVTFDDSGMVLVCSRGSNQIHQITADCKKVKVILGNTDGLHEPFSILFQNETGKLVIGQWNNNKLKVYQVTYSDI